MSDLSNIPRLTMKYLHILIMDIQYQDKILVQRIEQLEQQIVEIYQTREEIAATNEELVQDEFMTQEIQTQEIKISRAVKHKKSNQEGGVTIVKWFVYIIFAIMYLLITFFGIGPVLLADGSNQERVITLLIVLAIYVLVTIALRFIIKKMQA